MVLIGITLITSSGTCMNGMGITSCPHSSVTCDGLGTSSLETHYYIWAKTLCFYVVFIELILLPCGEGIIYGTHHLWRSLTSELTIGEVGHGSNAATIESLPGQRYIGISVALEMPMKLQEPGRHQSLCLIRSTVLSYYLVQVKSVSCNILS
jgi:hypothetical protein